MSNYKQSLKFSLHSNYKQSFIFLGIIILAHVFIFTKLLYYPYPELFVYPYLTNNGFKPYSQILDQHFPGLLFLPINFDNLGMNNEIIARIWSVGIIIIIHLLLFFIASKILKDERKALLVNILYLIWQPFFEGWVLWIDSLLPLLLLPAFYYFYKNKLFLSGLLLGIGIVFKQTLIPLCFLILIYCLWENKSLNQIKRLLTGMLIPIVLIIIYLTGIGVLKDFWYWTIVFNLTTYAKFGTSTPPTFGYVTRVLFVYSVSALSIFNKDKRFINILFIFLLGSLAGIFDRADFVHFQPSLPFALLATTLGFYQLRRNKFFKLYIILYLLIASWWLNIFYKGHIGNRIFFFDDKTKMITNEIKQLTKKEDKIFIFGAAPNIYQMTERLPAGDIFVYQFPWFLKIAGDRILQGLEKDKPNIIVSDRSTVIENQPITDFAKNIDQYIQKNYEVINWVGTTAIMRRKP